MPPNDHDPLFEKQIKAALAMGVQDSQPLHQISPEFRDKLMFEAGMAQQRRKGRGSSLATFVFGLAGGLLFTLLPGPKDPMNPVETPSSPTIALEVPTKSQPGDFGTATVWNWHTDPARIDDPIRPPSGVDFVTTTQPLNVRSFSPLLKELQQ